MEYVTTQANAACARAQRPPEQLFRVDSDDEATIDNPFAQPAHHDDRCVDETHRWESGFKLDIPEFHSSLTPDEFLDWLNSVEEVLDYKEVPPDCRVVLKLR